MKVGRKVAWSLCTYMQDLSNAHEDKRFYTLRALDSNLLSTLLAKQANGIRVENPTMLAGHEFFYFTSSTQSHHFIQYVAKQDVTISGPQ